MRQHFENQDALSHVINKRTQGFLLESHGAEMPGYLAAGAEAAKETGVILLLTWALLTGLNISFLPMGWALLAMGGGWTVWKTARTAWLGWGRLERLHRIVEQEKYEIEHHRPQEREELIALYRNKGFEGKLLEEVVSVLMADQDRLLRVMLEEELGLTLQVYDHPLKLSLGTLAGSFTALLAAAFFFVFFPSFGILIASMSMLAAGAFLSAFYEKNRIIAATIWNLAIGALAFGVAYFVFGIVLW
ncbi:MAG: VIT1/CCC1 transporter family protein [Chlamydiales bacterium]